MADCYTCDLIENNKLDNLIMENDHAMVTFIDQTREGQCLIFPKAHKVSMSEMDIEEYSAVGELIIKVSKALEKKYDCEKTYLLCISDMVAHVHFSLIPKHKDLVSIGYYCFGKLWEAEGKRETPNAEKQAKAKEIKSIIDKMQ
jgi:diadenosine tetraphosphate (Ap4A) HIT family hydrolase